MAKLDINIEGMHCGACATGIQMVSEGIDGVTKAFVDYNAKHGDIEYDESKVQPDAIISEIEKLGYKATPVG